MEAQTVVVLLGWLAARGLRVWVAGGWAVDALVGRQTRAHADLDLAVDAAQLHAMLSLLAELGFAMTVDQLPVRAELTTSDGRKVDLHPVAFAADGSGVQAGFDGGSFQYACDGFAEGTIAGHRVPCLSARQQLNFRRGYRPRAVDRHDVALLWQQERSVEVEVPR